MAPSAETWIHHLRQGAQHPLRIVPECRLPLPRHFISCGLTWVARPLIPDPLRRTVEAGLGEPGAAQALAIHWASPPGEDRQCRRPTASELRSLAVGHQTVKFDRTRFAAPLSDIPAQVATGVSAALVWSVRVAASSFADSSTPRGHLASLILADELRKSLGLAPTAAHFGLDTRRPASFDWRSALLPV